MIELHIRLIPRDDRHDLEIEPVGIPTDEIENCLEWCLHQIRMNKHRRLKVIRGGEG